MSHKKFGEKEAQFFRGMNPFNLSLLKSKEFAENLIVHRVIEMTQALITFKFKDKTIRCCPVNQLKLFAVQ